MLLAFGQNILLVNIGQRPEKKFTSGDARERGENKC
jgi:hypothetical protein